MNSKRKNKIAIYGGSMAAVLLLAGMTMPQPAKTPQSHKTAITSTPQIHPVCDFVTRGESVTSPISKTASVEPVSHDTDTQTSPLSQASPESPTPQPITAVPSPQIPAPLYHWAEPRALTNRERARLQTFPDTYVFQGAKESVRKQIGMAVPCDGARIIFEAVLKSFAGVDYEAIDANINE